MMPAPYSDDLRWQVIWFCPYSSAFSGRGFIFFSEQALERCISKFLVNDDVKPEPVGRSHGSISFVPCEELIAFAYQI